MFPSPKAAIRIDSFRFNHYTTSVLESRYVFNVRQLH